MRCCRSARTEPIAIPQINWCNLAQLLDYCEDYRAVIDEIGVRVAPILSTSS